MNAEEIKKKACPGGEQQRPQHGSFCQLDAGIMPERENVGAEQGGGPSSPPPPNLTHVCAGSANTAERENDAGKPPGVGVPLAGAPETDATDDKSAQKNDSHAGQRILGPPNGVRETDLGGLRVSHRKST